MAPVATIRTKGGRCWKKRMVILKGAERFVIISRRPARKGKRLYPSYPVECSPAARRAHTKGYVGGFILGHCTHGGRCRDKLPLLRE
jgi:hypothetical protein